MSTTDPIIQRSADPVLKRDLALALTLPNDASPIQRPVTRLSWAPASLTALWAIKNATRVGGKPAKHLPFAALRMALELDFPELLNHDGQVGLGLIYAPDPGKPSSAFAGFRPSDDLAERLSRTITTWVDQSLTDYITRNQLPLRLLNDLDPLIEQGKLLTLSDCSPILFPWQANSAGNSEAPSDGFIIGPHEIAQQLVGRELFPGLGPVHRVIKRDGRSTDLISPLVVARDGGRFHLVCSLELKTLPGFRQPLLQVNLHKRIWSLGLKQGYTSHDSTTGYLLDHRYSPPRAFGFGVVKDGSDWRLDDDYAVLARHFPELPPSATPQQIIDLPATTNCTVFIARHHAAEDKHGLELDAGVPERDKIDSFAIVADALAPLGFTPFTGLDVRRCQAAKAGDLRMDATVLIAELMQVTAAEQDSDTPATADIDQKIVELTGRSLAAWRGKNPLTGLSEKSVKTTDNRLHGYRNLSELSRGLLSSSLPKQRQHWDLYLISDDRRSYDLLKHIIHSLFGDLINTYQLIVPREAHGPRAVLPGHNENKAKRCARRAAAWRELLASVGPLEQPLCLIQAAAWYPEHNKPDDRINKVAARRTLAGEVGAAVQYLLPPDPRKKLDHYLLRVQAAVLDLVFGHHGLASGIGVALKRNFPEGRAPSATVGITVLQIKDPLGGPVRKLIAATRIDPQGGETMVKLAHRLDQPRISDWMPFAKATRYLATQSTLKLGNYQDARALYQSFCTGLLTELQQNYPGALVFIDSSHGASLWPWLSDKGNARDARWQNLRIVRVRDQAPQLIQQKTTRYNKVEDASPVSIIHATTVPRLFRISASHAQLYWSLAKPQGNYKRGESCYRQIDLADTRKDKQTDERITRLVRHAPVIDRQATPNAVEFTVLGRGDHDDPDAIACCAQQLRSGSIQARTETALRHPLPLAVMETLKEYM